MHARLWLSVLISNCSIDSPEILIISVVSLYLVKTSPFCR